MHDLDAMDAKSHVLIVIGCGISGATLPRDGDTLPPRLMKR